MDIVTSFIVPALVGIVVGILSGLLGIGGRYNTTGYEADRHRQRRTWRCGIGCGCGRRCGCLRRRDGGHA